MIWASSEIVAVLTFLLPGFVSAAVFYSLTSHPKPNDFGSVIQALMFTIVVQAMSSAVSLNVTWNQEVDVLVSVSIAIIIGITAAAFSNLDVPHRMLRKVRLTKENTYSSEWYSAFAKRQSYVVLHLKDGRRFFGWPSEWPSSPDRGHFRMTEGQWLVENNRPSENQYDGERVIQAYDVFELLIPLSEVSMVEFVYTKTEGKGLNNGKSSNISS